MLGIIGLLIGLILLMWLALRGVNIVFASILCSVIVIVTNAVPLSEGIFQAYALGNLGAYTFAGRFFLLFISGAIFGRIMSESHAAASIAMTMVRKLGSNRSLWIIVISCALLTYGGVIVFVVIFAVYPLGLRLLQEANIPKRLFCAALALGAGTFTLTALPGTPSIQNVIPTVKLGTDLFAGAWLGIFGGTIMFALGMWYLERERVKAKANGEGFVPGPHDHIPDLDLIRSDLPPWSLSIIPLVVVIATILAPRVLVLFGTSGDLAIVQFANAQPILWPSIALFGGSLIALTLFSAVRRQPLNILSSGTQDAIVPLMSTAAVIGFGGVVVATSGFSQFTSAVLGADVHPLLSMFAGVSVVSGITGSASGGLQIFMSQMADSYLAMGVSPDELHRLSAMASGGFDSLPHCGAIIAMLTITQLSHKEAYRNVGMVTVAIPTIATLCSICMAIVF